MDDLACVRGVPRSRLIRQLVREAAEAVGVPSRSHADLGETLSLLTERARGGNVTAMRALLEHHEKNRARERALEREAAANPFAELDREAAKWLARQEHEGEDDGRH